MPDIADAKANINDVEVDADAALSEALFEKIGGAINYLNTTTDDHETRITTNETASASTTSSAGGANTTSTSYVTANLSASITPVKGTKVLVTLKPDNTGFSSSITMTSGDTGVLRLQRGGVTIGEWNFNPGTNVPCSSIVFFDTGATQNSSNTYSFQIKTIAGLGTMSVNTDIVMVLAEIF